MLIRAARAPHNRAERIIRMDRRSAKEALKGRLREYVETITPPSKGGLYVCPLCGSGTGPNGTGAFSIAASGQQWNCFACGQHGDIFNLIGLVEHLPRFNDQLTRAAALFHIAIEDNPEPRERRNRQPSEPRAPEHRAAAVQTFREEPPADLTAFFEEAHALIRNTDYPQSRGLSEATIDRFNLGYDPQSRALIIPTSAESYVSRFIDKGHKPKIKASSGKRHIFNSERIPEAVQPLIIVEGEIDALSIAEVGGEALGLGGTSGIDELLALFEQTPPAAPVIIALDNDSQGEKAAEKLSAALEEKGILFSKINLYGAYKDANEALQRGKAAFTEAVNRAEQITAEQITAEKKAAEHDEYFDSFSVGAYMPLFAQKLQESINTPGISTGFRALDRVLDGGLYEGLYIIGAISSLGKTTLALQVADNVARSGGSALIFSLEMATTELIAKSISRHTLIRLIEQDGDFRNIRNAKTARGITCYKRYNPYTDECGIEHPGYSQAEKDLISEAIQEYCKYAGGRVFIREGIGDIGVKQIRAAVEQHCRVMGRNTVVIVDYLQILAPYNERATDKQNTDKAVLELKRIARDFKIPVIAISSFNRQNYKDPVTMEAFKESGAIEYSSDILIGLQFKGVGESGFDVTEAKRADPREIELKILKNRNGQVGDIIDFDYWPRFNYFEEE